MSVQLKMIDPEREGISSVEMKNGTPLIIGGEAKKEPLYIKYESQDPNVSDTQHDQRWVEDFVMHDLITVVDLEGKEEPLNEESGIYCKVVGRPEGVVAIDMANQRIMTEAEAQSAEVAFGREYPRFTKFAFYLTEAHQTDGPKRRSRLIETAEEQRNRDQSSLLETIEKAFAGVAARQQGGLVAGPGLESASVEHLMQALIAQGLSPEQMAAMAEVQIEDKPLPDDVVEIPSSEPKPLVTKKGK